jgi:hypothetical protein
MLERGWLFLYQFIWSFICGTNEDKLENSFSFATALCSFLRLYRISKSWPWGYEFLTISQQNRPYWYSFSVLNHTNWIVWPFSFYWLHLPQDSEGFVYQSISPLQIAFPNPSLIPSSLVIRAWIFFAPGALFADLRRVTDQIFKILDSTDDSISTIWTIGNKDHTYHDSRSNF